MEAKRIPPHFEQLSQMHVLYKIRLIDKYYATNPQKLTANKTEFLVRDRKEILKYCASPTQQYFTNMVQLLH